MSTSRLHGKYAEAVMAGRVFQVSNQAVVSTTAGLATAWTGLGLANPSASKHNAVMLGFGVGQGAAGAAGVLGLMGSETVTGLADTITPVNCKIGGTTSNLYADNGGTISTPTLWRVFGSIGSLATTGYALTPFTWIDLKGSLIIPPGSCVLTYTSGATTSALIFSFLWEEVPI